jgi:negative regulator of replication initiation
MRRLMPNQPKTPHRTIRVDDDLWHLVVAKAAERGETVSDVVRRALVRYVRRR